MSQKSAQPLVTNSPQCDRPAPWILKFTRNYHVNCTYLPILNSHIWIHSCVSRMDERVVLKREKNGILGFEGDGEKGSRMAHRGNGDKAGCDQVDKERQVGGFHVGGCGSSLIPRPGWELLAPRFGPGGRGLLLRIGLLVLRLGRPWSSSFWLGSHFHNPRIACSAEGGKSGRDGGGCGGRAPTPPACDKRRKQQSKMTPRESRSGRHCGDTNLRTTLLPITQSQPHKHTSELDFLGNTCRCSTHRFLFSATLAFVPILPIPGDCHCIP